MNWKNKLNLYGLPDKVIIALIVLAFISSFVEMIGISMFLPIFEYIENESKSNGGRTLDYVNNFLIQFDIEPSLTILLLITFSLFLISKIMIYIVSYTKAYYLGKMVMDMRNNLLSKYLSASSNYYDRVDIGNFVNSNISELGSAVSGVIMPISIIVTIISAIGSVVLLFILSYELTIVSVIIITLSFIYPYRWVKETTNAGKKNSKFNSLTTSFLLGRLRSPRLVRFSGTADAEMNEYTKLTEKQRQSTLNVHLLKAKVNLIIEPIVIGISLLMLYFSMTILKLELSIIILFMAVIIRIVPIINSLISQIQGYNKTRGPVSFIDNILTDLDCNKNPGDNLSKTIDYRFTSVESIEFHGIFYKYSKEQSFVLNDISFSIEKASTVAIIGVSGSGKSTLIDILSGYRQPTSGKLLINNIDLKNCDTSLLSSLISYVPQDPQIFDGTIYSHISYGSSDPTIENVKEASILSGAYEFIKDFPDEFNTLLIDNGSNLSGGQRQKLDIARALMKDAPMLILDEPTSSLDLFSENEFIKIVRDIHQNTNKIIITISHQPRIVVDADQIVILEKGTIVDSGTHTSLLSSNNWYRKMMSTSSV